MSYERWAVYSAKDHKKIKNIIVDLLLYDKIVLPTPVHNKTFEQWQKKEYDPELQQKRINQIGNELLVITRWDESLINKFSTRMAHLMKNKKYINSIIEGKETKIEGKDFINYESIPLGYTTSLLKAKQKENIQHNIPSHLSKIDLIAPYYNLQELTQEMKISKRNDKIGQFGIILENELELPYHLGNEETLENVIELVKSKKYKNARARLYKWQNEIFSSDYEPNEAIKALKIGTEELNDITKNAFKKTFKKSIFTFGSIGTSLVGAGFGEVTGLVSAGISTASFFIFDFNERLEPIKNSPFAIFYDIENKYKIKLKN
ncbi:hypothetical protein ACFFU1_09985 [Algibacter miyuki]|uniref:Uncharacterized protein n=1 Tax=Algibacter miyuki TaxID=1306933 RepID=A0ABV5H024_9FLAO|nr:hypothetical protein [Algibacter miyuki]MDN3667510.1 hypothetical protein [Algibacter miyuki]